MDLRTLRQRKIIQVVFDERLKEASYARAAAFLADRDFEVSAHSGGPLSAGSLQGAGVLVIARQSHANPEQPVGDGSPAFGEDELDAIDAFVDAGGGLIALGGGHDALLARFEPQAAEPELFHLVEQDRLPSAARPTAVRHGEGRVVAVADSSLFDDDHLDESDNRQLWTNLVYWAAAPAFRAAPTPIVSAAAQDPAWLRLKEATNALRALQQPKGEVDLTEHDVLDVRAHVETMIEAIDELAPRFEHEAVYLTQVPVDLRAWLHDGCGKPDFKASLALFRPEQNRRDGVEHLVVFPMYTPNGSPDTRFEALIVRTPWPEFVAQLEGELFDNGKFVPVQLVDTTDGYLSECAVLFPETVSLSERPTNNFGAIFCDREAARYQHSTARGSEVLHIDLPPDAAALVSNGDLARDTYVLWDLIHDRWHSHGDLPFDPFMIRQRLPYWMYSLEELRVDLATYGSAGELVRDGFPFARYVQYAILFDRILRFPITGNRVRNYDGLGGQLLFAYLHQRGVVNWSDNRLLVDWKHVEETVGELREKVEDLYRRGIDLSRVSYWIAAHDLVAAHVKPNVNSQWQAERRVYSDEGEPRAWIDRVLDDEFPLSMFYVQLKSKMEAA